MYFNSITIEQLISRPRINAFKQGLLKDPNNYSAQELIGSYIWNQQMAAYLYPLLQNLEIFLRNAIDNAVRNKYGNKWWDNTSIQAQYSQHPFLKGVKQAIFCLNTNWKKHHNSGSLPTWTHDQIIAATTLGIWVSLFDKDFFQSKNNQFSLWPSLLGKVFTEYHLIDNKPKQAVNKIRQILEELKDYRNRIAHHEPTWMKKPNLSPLDTIRDKIDKIELMYRIIHKDVECYMQKNGLIENALAHCDLQVLGVFQSINREFPKVSRKHQKLLDLNLLVGNKKRIIYRKYKSDLIMFRKF